MTVFRSLTSAVEPVTPEAEAPSRGPPGPLASVTTWRDGVERLQARSENGSVLKTTSIRVMWLRSSAFGA